MIGWGAARACVRSHAYRISLAPPSALILEPDFMSKRVEAVGELAVQLSEQVQCFG